MDKHLGFGVLINTLGGNEKTVNAIKSAIGKKIESLKLDNNKLCFEFSDGSSVYMWDDGQSCCENRYMHTDDDLGVAVGATLLDMELADGPDQEDEYGGVHEVQFLRVKTDKNTFVFANHNEHNGYYGGFSISAAQG